MVDTIFGNPDLEGSEYDTEHPTELDHYYFIDRRHPDLFGVSVPTDLVQAAYDAERGLDDLGFVVIESANGKRVMAGQYPDAGRPASTGPSGSFGLPDPTMTASRPGGLPPTSGLPSVPSGVGRGGPVPGSYPQFGGLGDLPHAMAGGGQLPIPRGLPTTSAAMPNATASMPNATASMG